MPNPGRYNITVYKGTTFTLAPVWKIGGYAVNLTDYSAKMQVRAATDASVLVELSTDNGKIVITPALGKLTLTLTSAQTTALTSGKYFYDLNLTAPDTTVTKILEGVFLVNDSVTQ
jgi:hypothetical protein